MKYDWITIAIEHGGVLTTSKNVHGIRSTMHWKGREPIVGDHHTTLPDAMTSLNSALEDDAAKNITSPTTLEEAIDVAWGSITTDVRYEMCRDSFSIGFRMGGKFIFGERKMCWH